MSEVAVKFFSIKPEHNLSLTITNCCEFINIPINNFNNSVVTKSECCGREEIHCGVTFDSYVYYQGICDQWGKIVTFTEELFFSVFNVRISTYFT